MNIEKLRSETPGCRNRNHLNNAGSSLMPEPVVRSIHEFIDREAEIGGYEAYAERRSEMVDAYIAVGDLLSTTGDHIAFSGNATESVAMALSSIPFAKDDTILTSRNDYASNQIQFLSLKKRLGIQIVRAPDLPEGGIDPEAVRELTRKRRPKAVCLTHIPTNSGLIQDITAVGAICREADITYIVDACQSVGQMPLNVQEIGCDFLAASARKFLRGPRGMGFMSVSDRVLKSESEPLFIDMWGADWTAADSYTPIETASRFENWEFPFALLRATGVAARYAMEIGLDKIRTRCDDLATRLRDGLRDVDGVRILDRGTELGALVSMKLSATKNCAVVQAMNEAGINVGAQLRTSATIDNDDKGIDGSVRLSPHYFNTEEEVDQAIEVVRQLAEAVG